MHSERRTSARRPVDIFVSCRVPATKTSAIMVDLSTTGCRVAMRERLSVGQTIMIKFRGWREFGGTVMWTRANLAGLHFSVALPDDMVDELVAEFGVERSDAA